MNLKGGKKRLLILFGLLLLSVVLAFVLVPKARDLPGRDTRIVRNLDYSFQLLIGLTGVFMVPEEGFEPPTKGL